MNSDDALGSPRRATASEWLAVPLLVAWLAGLQLVNGRTLLRAGRAVEAALREHRDPGPGLRERVDLQALQAARTGWVPVLYVLGTLLLVAGGFLSRPWPSSVAGAVLLVLVAGVAVRWSRSRTAAGRRWLADPPGPPREPPTPTRLMRWTSGRRLVGVTLGLLVVGVGGGLLAAWLTR